MKIERMIEAAKHAYEDSLTLMIVLWQSRHALVALVKAARKLDAEARQSYVNDRTLKQFRDALAALPEEWREDGR